MPCKCFGFRLRLARPAFGTMNRPAHVAEAGKSSGLALSVEKRAAGASFHNLGLKSGFNSCHGSTPKKRISHDSTPSKALNLETSGSPTSRHVPCRAPTKVDANTTDGVCPSTSHGLKNNIRYYPLHIISLRSQDLTSWT